MRPRINAPTFARTTSAATILAAAVALALFPVAPTTAAPACQERRMEVTVTPDATPYLVEGLLCPGSRLPRTIQVLLAGATESGLGYWDFPHPDAYGTDPGTWGLMRDDYSYAKYLTDRGYASLTIDRIGTGRSDRPAAALVTIDSNAAVLHQIIRGLKDGDLGFGRYMQVIVVGRSIGGVVAFVESATHGGADGLIIQSFRHHQQPPFAEFPTTFMPAQLEPRLAAAPPGYLTTRPNSRGQYFFSAAADPAVVDHEERLKDTITAGEVATIAPSFSLGASEAVTVPTLSIVGELDTFFCTAPGCPQASQEAAAWPNVSCFESVVVDGGAHNMNLEPYSATAVFPVLAAWVEARFGPGKKSCSPN